MYIFALMKHYEAIEHTFIGNKINSKTKPLHFKLGNDERNCYALMFTQFDHSSFMKNTYVRI